MNRLYLPLNLSLGQDLVVPDAAHHYLANVMRARTGDSIEAFDGKTGTYTAHIARITLNRP